MDLDKSIETLKTTIESLRKANRVSSRFLEIKEDIWDKLEDFEISFDDTMDKNWVLRNYVRRVEHQVDKLSPRLHKIIVRYFQVEDTITFEVRMLTERLAAQEKANRALRDELDELKRKHCDRKEKKEKEEDVKVKVKVEVKQEPFELD